MRAAAAVAPVYSGVDARPCTAGRPARGAGYTSVGTYDQTLPFYWRRTFELVAYRGELDYGLRHDPRAETAERRGFRASGGAARPRPTR